MIMISGFGRHIIGEIDDHDPDMDRDPGDLSDPLHDDPDHVEDEEEEQGPAGPAQDVQRAFCLDQDGI